MKLVEHFENFLIQEVNLNKSRVATLEERIGTVESFLKNSDWEPNTRRFSPQGSWAHKTIIKPLGTRGFDADVLVFVDPYSGWTAKEYVLSLRRVFTSSGTYNDTTSLGNRCVTIEYSGDFSIDVVPCIVSRVGSSPPYEVCNRTNDEFESTDSEAYTVWLEQRNNWAGEDKLREVTRLVKYLRDIKLTFTCKSILLTTLLGNQITQADALYQNTYFPDLPTALRELVNRLDDYLQIHSKLHDVHNPVLPTESFIRHWDDTKYENFRDAIHNYRGWIDDAFQETDQEKSLSKWQRVFGGEFGKGVAPLTEAAKADLVPIVVDTMRFRDAVDAVKSSGRAVLANVRTALPWLKPAPWRVAASASKFGVSIRATLHKTRSGPSIQHVHSGEVLRKGIELRFEAHAGTGVSFSSSKDFDIQWRVVNTGEDAFENNGLRGGFYQSTSRGIRWESTQYRGIHWVEAFVVRKRDQYCIGTSNRFFVVVE